MGRNILPADITIWYFVSFTDFLNGYVMFCLFFFLEELQRTDYFRQRWLNVVERFAVDLERGGRCMFGREHGYNEKWVRVQSRVTLILSIGFMCQWVWAEDLHDRVVIMALRSGYDFVVSRNYMVFSCEDSFGNVVPVASYWTYNGLGWIAWMRW